MHIGTQSPKGSLDPSSRGSSASGPSFHTTKEAARWLRVSHRTLEDWRMTGGGPSFRKFGRSVRYAVDDLVSYANRDTYSNTGQSQAA